MRNALFVIVVALAAFCSTARAQFSIDWFTVDGGGGTSIGGTFELSGTIGQPDAGVEMTGGTFSLTGGYWAGAGVPSNPCPWGQTGCTADQDGDGDVDSDDINIFFAAFENADSCGDQDADDDVDSDDINIFFAYFEQGGC